MKWIRWDVATPDHPVIHELAEALGVRRAQALGHFNAVCCRMGEHREDGSLLAVTDATLESWGLWEGKAGRFAEALRARCQDEAGRLAGWWRQDQLRERAERDRARKRRGSSAEPPRNGHGASAELPESHARARSVTSRSVVVDNLSELEGVRGNLPETSHEALQELLHAAPVPRAFLAELRAVHQGLRGKAYPWATIGRALEEMHAVGGPWSPRGFQAFCRKIAESEASGGSESEWVAAGRALDAERPDGD